MTSTLAARVRVMMLETGKTYSEVCSLLGRRGNRVKQRLAAQRKTSVWKPNRQLSLRLWYLPR
jgi:hypothetical protein